MGLLEPSKRTAVRQGSPPLCADLGHGSFHLSPEVLAPEGFCCPFLPRLATSSASLETSAAFPSTAGYSRGLWPSRILRPGLHTFRTFTPVLSRIAAFSFRREFGTCPPILPYQHWPLGRGKKPLAAPIIPPISFTRGPDFDGSFVRFCYGPPGCSPPGLIEPRGLTSSQPSSGFYVRAFSPWVTPRTAGYNYGAKWGIAPAGLPPASTAVSLAAPPPCGHAGLLMRAMSL